MTKSITGIDLGTHSVKLAVCREGRAERLIVETLPEGLMADGRLVSHDAMADFLKDVVRAHGGVAKDVALVIPSTDVLVRRVSLPAMSVKELELNLPYEFRDYLSQGKDHFYYDYAVLGMTEDEEGEPETMDLLACAVAKQTIMDFDAMLRRAGLRLRVAMPAVAAFQNLANDGQAGKSFCLVDFAHHHTALHFFAEGHYDVTRLIEVGGKDIDHAIAKAANVDVHLAGGYKEADFQGVLSCEAAQETYETIAVEVGRALTFYGFNNPTLSVDVAYCCGAGCCNQPLLEAVRNRTSMTLVPASELVEADPGLAATCLAAIGATLGA